MTTISLLSLWFYRSCVCTVVLTSTFFSNSRHRGIIARKTWVMRKSNFPDQFQNSLTFLKIPNFPDQFQNSLTFPWPWISLTFPWPVATLFISSKLLLNFPCCKGFFFKQFLWVCNKVQLNKGAALSQKIMYMKKITTINTCLYETCNIRQSLKRLTCQGLAKWEIWHDTCPFWGAPFSKVESEGI